MSATNGREKKSLASRKDAENAKESLNRRGEKKMFGTQELGAFLSDLGGLSECNERVHEAQA